MLYIESMVCKPEPVRKQNKGVATWINEGTYVIPQAYNKYNLCFLALKLLTNNVFLFIDSCYKSLNYCYKFKEEDIKFLFFFSFMPLFKTSTV